MGLVELLIATAVLAVLVAAGLAGLLQGGLAGRESAARQRVQERALYALATLESDLQMAGYFGLATPAVITELPDVPDARHCDVALLRDLRRAIEILPRYTLQCSAAAGGALSDSPVVVVRRASAQTAEPLAGRWQWLARPSAREPGRLLHDGALPAGVVLQPGRTELRNLVVRAYYLARGSDGDPDTPSLRVKSLTRVGGHPAFIDTEVMPGVYSMQITPQPAQRSAMFLVELGVRAEDAPRARIRVSRTLAVRNASSP